MQPPPRLNFLVEAIMFLLKNILLLYRVCDAMYPNITPMAFGILKITRCILFREEWDWLGPAVCSEPW